jgi:hypothetical protein
VHQLAAIHPGDRSPPRAPTTTRSPPAPCGRSKPSRRSGRARPRGRVGAEALPGGARPRSGPRPASLGSTRPWSSGLGGAPGHRLEATGDDRGADRDPREPVGDLGGALRERREAARDLDDAGGDRREPARDLGPADRERAARAHRLGGAPREHVAAHRWPRGDESDRPSSISCPWLASAWTCSMRAATETPPPRRGVALPTEPR